MMNVKKIVIPLNDTVENYIQLPIDLESRPMDNGELVDLYIEQLKRESVAEECVDFEKYRYKPDCQIIESGNDGGDGDGGCDYIVDTSTNAFFTCLGTGAGNDPPESFPPIHFQGQAPDPGAVTIVVIQGSFPYESINISFSPPPNDFFIDIYFGDITPQECGQIFGSSFSILIDDVVVARVSVGTPINPELPLQLAPITITKPQTCNDDEVEEGVSDDIILGCGFKFKFNFLTDDEEGYINSIFNNNFSWGHLFTNTDIFEGRNRFIKSFWRIDYFSTNDVDNQRPLFFQIIHTEFKNPNVEFTIDYSHPSLYLYWYSLENDCVVEPDANGDRCLYFRIRFFNASNGRVYHFFRTTGHPDSSVVPTESTGIPTMDEYTNNFKEYLFVKVTLTDDFKYSIDGADSLIFNEIKVENPTP